MTGALAVKAAGRHACGPRISIVGELAARDLRPGDDGSGGGGSKLRAIIVGKSIHSRCSALASGRGGPSAASDIAARRSPGPAR